MHTCTRCGFFKCESSMNICGVSRMIGSCSNSESVDISVAEFNSTTGDDDSESLWTYMKIIKYL